MKKKSMTTLQWTSQDLLGLPDNGKRYEIIKGELYISKQPHYNHQVVCSQVGFLLKTWSRQTSAGIVYPAPGIIFADDDDVAPDVVWISKERADVALEADGKLHLAPELVVEVLSPDNNNEKRDREVKLKLYSRRGVSEYWRVSWPKRQLELYRRNPAELALELVQTLFENDTLKSSLLPGFSCQVSELFEDVIIISEENNDNK